MGDRVMLPGVLKAFFPSRDAEQLVRSRLDAWDTWLQPVARDNEIGRDPGYEDAFFALKDEASKLSGIDDALVAGSCEQLIKETGKDLRLAGYYAGARLRQDGPAGFADGRASAHERKRLQRDGLRGPIKTLDGRGHPRPLMGGRRNGDGRGTHWHASGHHFGLAQRALRRKPFDNGQRRNCAQVVWPQQSNQGLH
ncbi:hypothetical protein BHU16_09895 [Tannerella sp. oral taxon 808]|nr:hypothetical protein BHU16_09895 [Tannerella sp. oral taxon 808]